MDKCLEVKVHKMLGYKTNVYVSTFYVDSNIAQII